MPLNARSRRLYAALGRRVSKLRAALPGGITQDELAARSEGELSRSTVANIETGRHRVAVHQLFVLAKALGCRPADLLPRPGDLDVHARTPRGAREDDRAAAEMMRRLEKDREISVLDREK